MRHTSVLLICLTAIAFDCAVATTLPITAKEISLMLRSGYSSDAVLREVSVRKFADTFDSAVEKQLTQAGANAALIEALQSGAYQLTESEIAAFKEKVAMAEEHATQDLPQPYGLEKTNDERSASPKTSALVARPGDLLYRLLKGDLVYWHQGSLVPFDDTVLEKKKLYLFFFSALSSRDGRQFTPQLVDYYNRISPQHSEFEVVFFSADRSQFGMETYIGQTDMPWPAVAFDKVSEKLGKLPKGLVRGVPFLVLADAAGKIFSSGGASDEKNNLDKVLQDLDRALAHVGDNITSNP